MNKDNLPTLAEYIVNDIITSGNVDCWEKMDLGELIAIALDNGSSDEFHMSDWEYCKFWNLMNDFVKEKLGIQELLDERLKEIEENHSEYREALSVAINN